MKDKIIEKQEELIRLLSNWFTSESVPPVFYVDRNKLESELTALKSQEQAGTFKKFSLLEERETITSADTAGVKESAEEILNWYANEVGISSALSFKIGRAHV